jgi:hypothetical protein
MNGEAVKIWKEVITNYLKKCIFVVPDDSEGIYRNPKSVLPILQPESELPLEHKSGALSPKRSLRSDVLTVMTVKIIVFRDMIDIYHQSEPAGLLLRSFYLKTGTVGSSETPLRIHQTTELHILQDSSQKCNDLSLSAGNFMQVQSRMFLTSKCNG